MSTKFLPLLLCFCLLVISGCDECNQVIPQSCPVTPVVAAEPVVVPTSNVITKVYSCEACPVLQLDATMPAQVQTGTEFEYSIKVTNLTDEIVTNVIVTDVAAANIQYIRSNPQSVIEMDRIKWIYPQLAPRETKEIVGTAIARSGGEVLSYVDVIYTAPIRLRAISLQPKLAITKSAPAEISVCAPVLYIFRIENTGTGTANNVKLYDNLPQGLTTTDGRSNIDMPLGDLAAGESKIVTTALTASKTGVYVNNAVVVADGDVTAESGDVTTAVRKPVLQIAASGPATSYVFTENTYNISVTNMGDWPAIDTVVENVVPQGMKFIRAGQCGTLCGDKVVWKVARINPGDTVTASVTFAACVMGTIDNTATASAACADSVSATTRTLIKGAAGILLEVSDTTDPIRVGNITTYRIVATNQGSIPVTNISIKALLEPSMNFVSIAGATRGQFSADGTIIFEPLACLSPNTQAIWEVTVRAASQGDVRFQTEMTADQLDRNVMETESTHFFE